MTDLDERLRAYGQRWRDKQRPPPPIGLALLSLPRRRRLGLDRWRVRNRPVRLAALTVVAAGAVAAIVFAAVTLSTGSAGRSGTTIVVGPATQPSQPPATLPSVTEQGVTVSVSTNPAAPIAGSRFELLIRVTGARKITSSAYSFFEAPTSSSALPNGIGNARSTGFCVEPSVWICTRYLADEPGVIQISAQITVISAKTGNTFSLTAPAKIPVSPAPNYASLTLTVTPGQPRAGQTATLTAHMRGGPEQSVSFRVDFGDGNNTGSGPQDCTAPLQTSPPSAPPSKTTIQTQRFRHAWITPGQYHLTVEAFENGGCVTAAGYASQQFTLTVR